MQAFTEINGGELQHIENVADLFLQSNQENSATVIRNTPFYGGKFSHVIESFPDQSVFEGRVHDQKFSRFWVARLEWSVGTYIESLRFTLANGSVSPKFGSRPFTNNCELSAPIRKIEVTYRERGIVSLTFLTASGEELKIQGEGEGKHSDRVVVSENLETLVQFRVRVAQNLV